jgi:nucleoporin p58/p45
VMEEKASIQELMTVVNEMMWNTKIAMRSYMMLRPRFTQPGGGAILRILLLEPHPVNL